MISPHKTPALAKMAMLLLFAIGAVAVLGTNTISAQELGRTITSPFGIARQISSLESGSDEDTFVDPETGEVGHIIRNPFGIANPEGVDTGIDIPDNGEEVGGIITSPFGVPASDDIDTGVDVFDEDEEYLISLPEKEDPSLDENDVIDNLDDPEVAKETISKIVFVEDFSRIDESGVATKGSLPPKDAPRNTGEDLGFDFKLVGTSEGATSVTVNSAAGGTLYVLSGNDFVIEAQPIRGQFPGDPTWTITSNNPGGPTSNSGIPYKTGVTQTSTQKTYTANSAYEYGSYTITVRSDSYNHTVIREIDVVVVTLNLTIQNPIGGNSVYASLLATNIADESSTNIANESSAEKPDYANFEARSGETSLKRMDLRINFGHLNRNQCKVKFLYEGVNAITDPETTPPTIANNNLKYIYKRKSTDQYYDYSANWKQKELRIWASPDNSLTDKSSRNYRNYKPTNNNNGGNYLAPDTYYTINELNPNGNSSECTKELYLEGINPSADTVAYTPITVELYYNNKKIVSKVVTLNIIESKVILNVNNDPNYLLDETDHKIKDQCNGFQGWFADEFNTTTFNRKDNTHGLENLFPVLLKELPKLPSNMKYVLELSQNQLGVIVKKPEGTSLNYITDSDKCEDLLSAIKLSTKKNEITNHNTTGDEKCLFGVYVPVDYDPQQEDQDGITGYLSLYLCAENSETTEGGILLDNALYTFRPVEKFFEMWFTRKRNDLISIYNNYPTDNGRHASESYSNFFYVYDYPICLDEQRGESGCDKITFAKDEERDNSKPVFIFLHGFNVTEEEAFESNRIFFRRMYWTGYRGNYIGITWDGDYYPIPWDVLKNSDIERLIHKSYFDTDVFHALQTSPAVCSFVKDLIPCVPHVNMAAHSLGNLVMWDALRLLSCEGTTNKISNAISFEGAVWSEAFRDPEPLYYLNETNSNNNIIYTFRNECVFCKDCPVCNNSEECTNCPDCQTSSNCKNCQHCQNYNEIPIASDLEKHSWSHWFRQPEHSAFSVVDRFVNSRTDADYALIWMKRWNTLCHGFYDHYDRTFQEYRSPMRNSLPEYAALLKQGHRVESSFSENAWDTILAIITNIATIPFLTIESLWNDNIHLIEEIADDIFLYTDYLSDPIGLTDLKYNNSNNNSNSDSEIDFHLRDYELGGDESRFTDYNAKYNNWDSNAHSDYVEKEFFDIHLWYNHVFEVLTHIISQQ